MEREYPARPILGVGTIVVEENSVLLIRRGKQPGLGIWTLPGGRVNIGESTEDAAVRETEEETGLTVKIAGLVEVVNIIFKEEDGRVRYHYFLLDYLARPTGGELMAQSDALDARFFTTGELGSLNLVDITKKVIAKAIKMHDMRPQF